jgi:hypothetical protein
MATAGDSLATGMTATCPTLLRRTAGRGPTMTPAKQERLRNWMLSYDYWPTETVAVLPNHRPAPAETRLLLPAHPSYERPRLTPGGLGPA